MRLKFVKLLAILVCLCTSFSFFVGLVCFCHKHLLINECGQEMMQKVNDNQNKFKSVVQNDKTGKEVNKDENVELLCLMYHNVVAEGAKENDYEITWKRIEHDFIELNELGYSCVSCTELAGIVKKQKAGRYVMITFDDGFYGVYKYIPRLLEKYNMKCVVAVVGEFLDMADKLQEKTRCSYMNSKEVQILSQNPRVEIAHHTYYLHHHSKYSRGARIRQGESKEAYFARFGKDTELMEKRLTELNIYSKIFCYPYGEYCRESEQVLKSRGYKVTMTCVERKNILNGDKGLFLISRVNRSSKYENILKLNNLICKK